MFALPRPGPQERVRSSLLRDRIILLRLGRSFFAFLDVRRTVALPALAMVAVRGSIHAMGIAIASAGTYALVLGLRAFRANVEGTVHTALASRNTYGTQNQEGSCFENKANITSSAVSLTSNDP